MFIHKSTTFVAERNSQYHTKGVALCLVVPANERYDVSPQVVGAVVRTVTYKPFGNFAVADISIGGERYGMWGDLGDGTGPIAVYQDIFDATIKVPTDVMTRYHELTNGGFPNLAKAQLTNWARDNEKKLSLPVNRKRPAERQ